MSEAARIRESIDLAEFERRLRGAPAEEPQAAQRYEAAQRYAAAPADAAPRRAAYPRAAGLDVAAANPVANLREQLEVAAGHDPFQAVVNRYPDAAERLAAAPPPPLGHSGARPGEPGWRPEAFEPLDESKSRFWGKRAMLLGGAAMVLVVGVGVTIAMRGESGGGVAPTIRASGEPYKIQPEAKPAGEKPSEAATILDRNGSERLAASRVVTHEEQPVDLREAARQAAAANRPGPSAGAPPSGLPTAGPAANGFFPEPRRVRTVSVRPDGTIIGEAPQAAPAAPPARVAPTPSVRPASPAPGSQSAAPPQTPVRVAAATPPKTSERAGSTITAPATTASTGPAAQAPVRAAAPESATVAATPTSSGAYAVQLAAPGSPGDAKVAISNLQRRYGSTLGGLQPIVRKATVGSRDVYRVRVVGLSRSDANGLCEKLKGAGGSCFVARE